jgi:2-keto-4-pentenoate hydratase/2-oxohepta-3-ene-1,7-dioic acid hydratase in catechol pathway
MKLTAERLGTYSRLSKIDGFPAPISSPTKIVGVGLNCDEHARESGLPTPSEPVLFSKAPSALSGPNERALP